MQKVNASQAISNFEGSYGVAIVKRATGKLYVKLSDGECYATREGSKLIFSSDNNATGFLNNPDSFEYKTKKVKLTFDTAEVNQFDFFTIDSDMDVEDVVNYFVPRRNAATKAAPAKEEVAPRKTTPVDAPQPAVTINVFMQPKQTASAKATAFRNLLNS